MNQPLENLLVWQKSMKLAKDIYELTQIFPKEEQYGLVSQMKRSAVSIPSNIAEGSHRGSDRDFARFIQIAYGSWAELKTQLLLSCDLAFISSAQLAVLMESVDEVGKMLKGFQRKLTANCS